VVAPVDLDAEDDLERRCKADAYDDLREAVRALLDALPVSGSLRVSRCGPVTLASVVIDDETGRCSVSADRPMPWDAAVAALRALLDAPAPTTVDAVAAERERCARVCDAIAGGHYMARICAAAIRALPVAEKVPPCGASTYHEGYAAPCVLPSGHGDEVPHRGSDDRAPPTEPRVGFGASDGDGWLCHCGTAVSAPWHPETVPACSRCGAVRPPRPEVPR